MIVESRRYSCPADKTGRYSWGRMEMFSALAQLDFTLE